MTAWRTVILLGCIVMLSGCGGGSWVHPTKPQDAFAAEYNSCNNDVLKDPKLQQGNAYLVLQATERCMRKRGWEIKSEE